MSISISGVGSGLPINEWIEAFVEVEQSKIDSLTAQQEELNEKSNTLNTLKSTYSAVNTATLKFTDALYGASSDIFAKISVTTSDEDNKYLTATATQLATPAILKISVQQLASPTARRTYGPDSPDGKQLDFSDSSVKLSDLGYDKEGTFTINGATFAVDGDTTIDGLVYQINNSSDANVSAHLEDGQIVLEGTDLGAKDIVIEDGEGSDFASWIGWTDDDNLTVGQNAIFTINGKQKEASKNNLTSAETGVTGLSLELKEVTGDEVVKVNITRESDADGVLEALKSFVEAFNKAINDTDTETDSEGSLYGENTLVSIRNRLRNMITTTVNSDGVYKSLADIGITSVAPGMDVDADTTSLVIDEEKFYEAFRSNPAAVKELLIGTNANTATGEEATQGIMQMVQDGLDTALNAEGGYFTARSSSLSSQLSRLADKIADKEEDLEIYRERITQQFNYMDQQIAAMNNQYSQLVSQLSSIGVSSSS